MYSKQDYRPARAQRLSGACRMLMAGTRPAAALHGRCAAMGSARYGVQHGAFSMVVARRPASKSMQQNLCATHASRCFLTPVTGEGPVIA